MFNSHDMRGTSDTSVVPPPFWQTRFYDFNVWTEQKRIKKLRYIHRNPVHRGLVASPEQWLLEQLPSLLLGEESPVRLTTRISWS
jgi:putative transposase